MFGILARKVLLPVHERLLGRPTLRLAAELEASQWRSPAEIRALQGEKLGALLNHAARHTRFYRDRFAQAGVDVLRDDPSEVLLKLPVLSKAEIRANIEKMVWAEVAGGLHPFDTGGSSGEPLHFFVCRRRQAADQAARIRTHRWFGAEFGDRELYLWGSPIELRRTDRYKAWRDRLFNHRLLSAFDMSPVRLDAYFDELDRFRPHCIFGYPSSLALLANYGRSRGRAGNLESLKAVFVTGEVCFPHDRENLGDYFQCPVADGYGARDAGFLAHECPDGGMHINAEQVFIEILRDGRPVEAGESGEIVVTHLEALGMPLIRYQTGDVGRLQVGRCTCGRGLPLMDVVEGRTTDFVHLPDGTRRHALAVIYPLREREDVGAFRIRQRVNYVVQVEVSGVEGRGAPDREAIATAVGRAVGGDIPVRVEVVDRITASASGKFQYVRSEVAQGRVAWEPACVAGLAKGAGHGA